MADRAQGYKYQLSVTAYLASLLSKNETVKDYYIVYEVKELEPFDDIVLAIRYNDSEDFRLYLIQVKSGKVKLSEVNNYWKVYKRIKENKCWEKCLANIGGKISEEDIQFCYFACQKFRTQPIPFQGGEELEIRRRTVKEEKLIINEKVYELFSKDDDITKEYQDFFKQFYIYLEQIDTNTITTRLKGMWALNDAAQVIEYLDKYFTKNKRECLSKADFEHELLRIRLWDSIVKPTKITSYTKDAALAWNKLTLSYNVTAVKNELDVETCLFGCISRSLDKQITVEQWNAFVDNDGKLSKDIKYKFTSKPHKPETLKDLLVYLWRCGRIPLVLKSNSVLPQLKDFLDLNQHYVIIDSEPDRRYNEIKSYNLTAIKNLGDTSADQLLQSVLISMQGRRPASLYTVINGNEKLKQSLTCLDILKLMEPRRVYINNACLEVHNFTLFIIEMSEPELSNYKDYDPNGDSFSIYCNIDESTEVYEKVKRDFKFKNYKIYCLRLENDKLTLLGKFGESKLDNDFQSLASFQIDQYGKNVYRIDEDHAVPIIGKVTNMNCLNYLRRYMRKGTVEEDRNGDDESTTIKFSETIYSEEHFFKELDAKICVVTGEAGVGKTTFLQALMQTCNPTYYLLFCNLAELQVDMRKKNQKLVKDPLNYLWNQQGRLLYDLFLNMLRKERKRFILILDSFDEVIPTCKEEVLELLTKLNDEACLEKIIIGSRLLTVQLLTNQFQIDVAKIELFSNEYNGRYLENWNLDEDSLREMPLEFITNPLYLNMLRTISGTYDINFQSLSRWTLYNRIVDLEMERYSRRIKHNIDDSERKHILRFHWGLALKLIFGDNPVNQKYAQEDQMKFTNATRLGIIKYYNKSEDPVFVHHTFAEFLVVQWMIETADKEDAKFIYKIMLGRQYCYMLDIYSKELPLHKAVLNAGNEYDEIVEEIEKLPRGRREVLLQTDLIGRTVLHLVGSRYHSDSDKCIETIIRYMREEGYDLYSRDNLLNWTWIDYCDFLSEEYIRLVSHEYYATHEAYWKYCAISPSTKSIDSYVVFSSYKMVVDYFLANILDNLLLVSHFDNKDFRTFRNMCLNTKSSIVELPKYFELDDFNLKPIHLAVIYSNIDIVTACIERGDDINDVDYFKCTPLYYGVLKQNYEIIKLLLKKGGGKRTEDSEFTTFQLSLRMGNKDITKLLIEAVDLKKFGSDWLRDAIKFGDIEAITLLLKTKIDSNVVKNKDGNKAFDREIDSRNALRAVRQFSGYNYDVSAMPLDKSLSIADALRTICVMPVNYSGFHTAMHARRNDIVQLLLKNGVNVNKTSICIDDTDISKEIGISTTLLCCAIRSWNIDVVELLLQYGANVNFVQENALTPLKIAIRKDITMHDDGGSNVWLMWMRLTKYLFDEHHIDISQVIEIMNRSLCESVLADRCLQLVEVLLRHGADVDYKVKGDITPLEEALNDREWRIVEILLLHGANPNKLEQWDFARLLAILPTEDIKIVELLLKNGAEPDFKTVCDVTPLYVAARRRHADIIRLLFKYGASADIITCNHTLLTKAKETGDVDIVIWLLELGEMRFIGPIYDTTYPVDVLNLLKTVENQVNINFGNEIAIICNDNDTNLIKSLILYVGELTNPYGMKYLKAVLELRNPKIDQILLKHLWSICEFPVVYAAKHRNETMIEILTRNGQGVNSRHKFGYTALVSVIEDSMDKSIVRFLLENQADVNLADKYSNTPLIMAIKNGNIDVIEILLEYKAKVNYVERGGLTPLIAAINLNDVPIVRILLENGADVNFVCKSDLTPLYVAILKGNNKIIKMLRFCGTADIETRGNTLLYNAIKLRHKDIIQLLLNGIYSHTPGTDEVKQSVYRNLAEVNTVYEFGSTPLHLAAKAGDFEIVRTLLIYKPDSNQVDEDGRTALHYANVNKNSGIIYLLENVQKWRR